MAPFMYSNSPAIRRRSVGLAFAVLATCMAVTGCATNYGEQSLTGGYSEQNVGADQWVVRFLGNGYTTPETVQVYWLYHCAEFTLAKGYKGFAILTPLDLAADGDAARRMRAAVVTKAAYFDDHAQVTFKPTLSGRIRMLSGPFQPRPERHVFDAAALKAALAPLVLGPKCGGNICPHVHSYLYSDSVKNP